MLLPEAMCIKQDAPQPQLVQDRPRHPILHTKELYYPRGWRLRLDKQRQLVSSKQVFCFLGCFVFCRSELLRRKAEVC